MTNIILCGGSGTRLWPISRTLMPKQFVKLFDNKSLFQLTVERNQKFCDSLSIVSNAEQYFLAIDQLDSLSNSSFLLEPVGRNTAPAIALACLALDSQEVVLVTPSDHLIKDESSYQKVVTKAKEEALNGNLVTFGITPQYPETGFGYIEADGINVKSSKEKPDCKTAQAYIDAGNYYWNSGMFCFKAGLFLDELKLHSPEIYHSSLLAYENANKEEIIRVTHDDMFAIPEDSIDYAVMERSSKVRVIPSDINWSDVGSFDALYDELSKDNNGNSINDKHIAIDSKNNLIYSHKQVATIDIEDLIIIDTDDALLISKKGSSQKVKKVVSELKKSNSHLSNIHMTAHRPWGTYAILEDTPGYKIKRIVVKPNKRLSLQKHYHRNEYWIVVSGTALVTVGTEQFLVRLNESTYIKMGEVHRLENQGKIDLVLIEAQVGEYTGEDDIVRLDDDFKRLEIKGNR
jgi:mannose-1-phosphate guanylyltransferase